MRVSRRSLLSRVIDDGDWFEDWAPPPGRAGLEREADELIANMSQQEAQQADQRARDPSPWIDPRLAHGARGRTRRGAGEPGASQQ